MNYSWNKENVYKYISWGRKVWLLILGNYGRVFSKTSPRLGNGEYNYHDFLQAGLMSGGTFVDQPIKRSWGCRVSFHRSSVNKEIGWKLFLFHRSPLIVSCHTVNFDDKRPLRTFNPRNSIIYKKAQHPAKITHCLYKHLQCIHLTLQSRYRVRATKLPSINISRHPGGRSFTALYSTNTVQQYRALFKNPFLVRDTSGLQWNTYGVFLFVVRLIMRWNLSPIRGAFTIFSGS